MHSFYFQNSFVSATAPKPAELKPSQLLPREIFFYIRVGTYAVSFPFPPTIPEVGYLHRARLMPGHEPGGPSAALQLGPSCVIGLMSAHMNGKHVSKQWYASWGRVRALVWTAEEHGVPLRWWV